MRQGRLRIEREHALKTSGRVAEPAEMAERQAAIVMGVGIIRLERRGALETGRGLYELALGAEYVAEIVMRLGEVRLERYGTLEKFGSIRPAELMGDDAEAVETTGMVRIGGADLAVPPLGLGQPPRLVMSRAGAELSGDLLPLVRSHGAWPPAANATTAARGSLLPTGVTVVLR